MPLPALYWAMDKVGGPESRSVTTRKPISSQLQHGKLIRVALIRLDFLVLHAKLSSRLDKVIWGIIWKVFRRSYGPPTRSVGPTVRSASLLVGRTHLSGTAVSLVGGDPWVPMSHTTYDRTLHGYRSWPDEICKVSLVHLYILKIWEYHKGVSKASFCFQNLFRNSLLTRFEK
jgi:hypothetical protein